MSRMNYRKYRPYPSVDLPDRTWPAKTMSAAPAWCSVDLRDGNQALGVPMSVEEKLEMFELLVRMGFKEIEVAFPSASAVDYRFVRRLIEEGRIPGDVTIQVLTQAREHLIRRTVESLAGAKKAVVHLYNSTSVAQREVVFKKSREEIKDIAGAGTRLVRALKPSSGIGDLRLEYSPESFTGTELDYALEVCCAVMDAWEPSRDEKIILNLPSTVEMSTPNVYADRIEWFCRNLKDRAAATVSVHPHNDRGTAVAAAELAVLAGAERVEGALFGNGERSGNMDIVTMALNLFSRGVDPGLDLSNIDAVKEVCTRCTRMAVHPRHPYAGELVFTAFSGSHQDAISKGMKAYAASPGALWDVPYLPVDPRDIGRTYEAIIRINSQSGKGGVAFVMEREFGIDIPRWMQPDLGRAVQEVTDRTGKELAPAEIFECFRSTYLAPGSVVLEKCRIDTEDDERGARTTRVAATVRCGGKDVSFEESGNGPVDAFVRGLQRSAGLSFTLEHYAEHAVARGTDAKAAAYVCIRDAAGSESFGAGMDENIAVASLKAVLSAVNRMAREG